MKRVISVSLGSDAGNFQTIVEIMGVLCFIARIGVNGNMKSERQLLRYFDSLDEKGKTSLLPPPGIDISWLKIDGPIDAIGLGGTDIYIWRKRTLREGKSLLRELKRVSLLDGYGVKITLERLVIEELIRQGVIDNHARVFLTSAADREGMAIAFQKAMDDGKIANILYGDLMYALGIPIALSNFNSVDRVARIVAPIVTQLPISWIYPMGEKQNKRKPKFEKWQEEADVIAGDCHQLMKHLPLPSMQGKIVVTNTTTAKIAEEIRLCGFKSLITTTPSFKSIDDGKIRTPGTNVIEALLVAFGASSDDYSSYYKFIKDAGWGPNIIF